MEEQKTVYVSHKPEKNSGNKQAIVMQRHTFIQPLHHHWCTLGEKNGVLKSLNFSCIFGGMK